MLPLKNRGRLERARRNRMSRRSAVRLDTPQADFGLHTSHVSVPASRVITSGKTGLYSAMVKHRIDPRPTVQVTMRDSVGGPAWHEDEQCPGRIKGSRSIAEPLSTADCIEEWNRPQGSGKLFDPNPEEG